MPRLVGFLIMVGLVCVLLGGVDIGMAVVTALCAVLFVYALGLIWSNTWP